MEGDGVRCWDDQVDSPANRERPDERHDRERQGEHPEAEIRRRHVAGRAVVILIEEAEASCEGEQRGSHHQAANPPDLSQLLTPHGTHLEPHLCMSIASPGASSTAAEHTEFAWFPDPGTPSPENPMGHERHSGARTPH
jgi:hypothetical protein